MCVAHVQGQKNAAVIMAEGEAQARRVEGRARNTAAQKYARAGARRDRAHLRT